MHRQEVLEHFKNVEVYFKSQESFSCIPQFLLREGIPEYMVKFSLSNFWKKYTDKNVRNMDIQHFESNEERVKVIGKIITNLIEDGIPPPYTNEEKEKKEEFYENAIGQHIEFQEKLNIIEKLRW